MEFPCVDGRIYVRTIEGEVVCCDMRKRPRAKPSFFDFGNPGNLPIPISDWNGKRKKNSHSRVIDQFRSLLLAKILPTE
jgi:hypothetical protein